MALEPIKISVDRAAVREIESDLAHLKNGAERAMSRAINHTLGVTRTEASREIRSQVRLKAAYVRERLKVRKATVTKASGAIQTPSRGQLLSRYPYTVYANNKGIGVSVKPGAGSRQRMPGAFEITFANGVTAIAIRTKRGSGLGRSEGLKVLYGPSISQVFTDVKDDLQAPSGERLMQRLGVEADRLLNQQ